MLLESLGADAAVFGAFQSYAAQGLTLGRVAFSHRDQYRITTEAGEVSAEPSGAFWFRAAGASSMPAVGDWVAARVVGTDQALVEAVLPRRTCFSRRAAGKREDEQVIAANIDIVFLVCGLDDDFNLRRLERYLALTVESGAAPVVVLNKADLCDDLPARIDETAAIARGAEIVAASSRSAPGIDGLRTFLTSGRTVALLGSSGAGKSTIVNGLLGEDRLRTAEVRESDSRGRHTTTHRELLPLRGGGALIDTPGMRELQLWAGAGSIEQTFDEIAAAGAACRFRDCSHHGEPGCAVQQALDDGTISPERWQSYGKLLAEARRHERMAEPLQAQEAKRKLKQLFRAYRKVPKR
jgi:ribosome biogenesis GTPase / thiamine phosphate phosphatase